MRVSLSSPAGFAAIAVISFCGCSAGNEGRVTPPNETTVPAGIEKRDPLVERADALIADLKKREAEFKVVQDELSLATFQRATAIPVVIDRSSSYRATPPPPPSVRNPAAPPAPATISTGIDAMKERAMSIFGDAVERLCDQADALDADYRRYMDDCYGNVATVVTRGTSRGSGSLSSNGVAAGRDWFAVWDANASMEWQEQWTAKSEISLENSSRCRRLWSNIMFNANSIKQQIEGAEIAALQTGIYPGVIRDVRARYHLVW